MPEDVVWRSLLDKRYTVRVIRTGPYRGELSICDGEQLLHRQNVGLSYDALFGPDAGDVAEWRHLAVAFVDGLGKS